ncbi:unnamed protein product [Adineta steineri]|uniref:Poly [ADP-ribose] polymerase n=1 Tax=Adineta steineri TaxID=433720 RepID=A0A813NHS7_9BILA|nr:unnamed protein product [Adineta steineri]CAF0749913.1 unnamed protein product [Adineta steineri]
MAKAVETIIPCECCNSEVYLQDWTDHSKKCFDDRNKYIGKVIKCNTVNNTSDNEQIPCEFCNIQISIDDWNCHSKNCADAYRKQNEILKNIKSQFIDTYIPCEYCNTQVNIRDLECHTKQCAIYYKRFIEESQNNEPTVIPCEYCNSLVNAQEWKEHIKKCIDADKQKIEKMAESVTKRSSKESIPCEFCKKLYRQKKLDIHQKKCQLKHKPSIVQAIDNHQKFAIVSQNRIPGDNFLLSDCWNSRFTKNLTRYSLNIDTEEYRFVADNFYKTLSSYQIIKIERIQNRRWYRQYEAHKDDFIERYGNSTEQWLLHGCRQSDSAEAIILDCFNRSHAINCVVGQGIYFATQASISDGYTQPDAHKLRHMFTARVLVGRTTTGNSSTRVCPTGFDTTGGENIFVTYHDAQAYGQYLITYR